MSKLIFPSCGSKKVVKKIVGVHVSERSEQGARQLWDSLPSVYRQCAVAYTDFWAAYGCVFPQKRHKAVGKETGRLVT